MKGPSASGINILLIICTFFRLTWSYSFDRKNLTDHGNNGAVSSESAICSRAGTAMLEKGGNAADAIVATIFCVGVVGCHNSGIAGGGFALVRMPNNTFEVVDFREKAPAAAFTDMFKDSKTASQIGGNATAVPGQIRGLEYILSTYGRLNWSQVIEPAIEVAQEGFPVPSDMVWAINYAMNTEPPSGPSNLSFFQNPTWKPDFAPNGTIVRYKEMMTRKRYADTLRNISRGGPDSFYKGYIADTMIKAVKEAKGIMTQNDLDEYSIKFRDISRVNYRGYTLTSSTTPSSGAVTLNVLGILNHYHDFFANQSMVNISTHRMVEAIKFGYAYRNEFGDPDFVQQNLTELQLQMVSESNLRRLWAKINDTAANPDPAYYDPELVWTPESHGTSHMAAADKSGLTISITTTVNLPFGNHMMVPETGIILNSQMDDFSQPDTENTVGYSVSPNNFVKPGKRPLSSISPVIVTRQDGSVAYVGGAAGGRHIPSAVIQTIIPALDNNASPFVSLNTSRLHHQLFPNWIEVPPSFNNNTISFLETKNHRIVRVEQYQSAAQAIARLRNGTFWAASEPMQLQSGAFGV